MSTVSPANPNSTETTTNSSEAAAAAAAKMKMLEGCQLINVNITSSSPPDREVTCEDSGGEDEGGGNHESSENIHQQNQNQQTSIPNSNKTMSIIRANSASHGSRVNSANSANSQGNSTGPHGTARSQCNSRKSSTITFQTPDIKRPNSTTGIPTSGLLPTSQSLYNSFDHQNEGMQNPNYQQHQQYHNQQQQQHYQQHQQNHPNYHPYQQQQFIPDIDNNYSMINSGGPQMDAETPELDLFSPGFGFNPVREKAASLTLPDPKLHLLRKGSSNPFLTTSNSSHSGQWSNSNIGNHNYHQNNSNSNYQQRNQHYNQNHNQRTGHRNSNSSAQYNQYNQYNSQNQQSNSASVSPGQYSLPSNGGRTSIILNGNILHSISPLPPGRPPAPGNGGGLTPTNLSIHVQDASQLTGSVNFADVRCLTPGGGGHCGSSLLKPRGSTMSTMTTTAHRSSYIGDDEHTHLHQQYLATTGRKDTIISIGRNLQIQFRSPSTSGLAWRYRTRLEKFLLFLLTAFGVIIFSYFFIPLPVEEDLSPKTCTTMECVKTSASLLNAMDLSADPCEDFFQFACGTWVKKHVIPEDRSSLSTFEVMADDLQIILKDLLEQPPNNDNSATLKAKFFYKSCMNVQKIESIGDEPIREVLDSVGGWPVLDRNWDPNEVHFIKRTSFAGIANGAGSSGSSASSSSSSSATGSAPIKSSSSSGSQGSSGSSGPSSLKLSSRRSSKMPMTIENLLGKIRGDYNQPIIIEQYVGPDDRNSSHNIIQFDQTSFGLPSREYFLKEGPNKEKESYLTLMVDVAELLGADRAYATEQMAKVIDFETELANASMPEADRHDTSAIYNKKTIQELRDAVPEFDWMAYLSSFMPREVRLEDEVVVYSIAYYRAMGKILARTARQDKRVIINYAIWRLMKSLLPFLDGEYGVRRAKFRKVLFGISADRTRWSQCVELVNKKMGMAVGALFIRDNFDPKSKEIAIEMIHNIRQAFNELLLVNDWMDESTKVLAKEKADAINERIGYPDLLTNPIELSKEYDFLEVHEDKFLENIISVFTFESHKNLIKLGTSVDKDSWTTDPAVVNAFYSPNKNDIVFPAGILQPLFYSHYFPKSLNYGGIGVVIGHEITHGFDDRGRQFDKNGNMKQWWNNATIKRFRSRTECIIDQYSSYVLEDISTNVNGKMTQGENIGNDNGGVKEAYLAFKRWESQNGVEPLLPGLNLTHDQLFFLNYAQIWCGSMRPEDALNKIRSSVHSPGPIRVLGPLSNSYDFAKAYNCPVGSKMNPVKKCSVW